MAVKTVTFKAYAYDDLPDEAAKEKAVEWMQQRLSRRSNVEDLSMFFGEALEEIGLQDAEVFYSLGYCQGDGMAFSGRLDLEDFVRTQSRFALQLADKREWRWHECSPQNVYRGIKVGDRVDMLTSYVESKKRPGKYDTIDRVTRKPDSPYEVTEVTRNDQGVYVIGARHLDHEAGKALLERWTDLTAGHEAVDCAKLVLQRGIDLNVCVTQEGRYTHYNSMDVRVTVDGFGDEIDAIEDEKLRDARCREVDGWAEGLEKAIDEYVKDVSHHLEARGYEIIEDNQSEERAIEELRDRALMFHADGTRFSDADDADADADLECDNPED